MYLFIYIDFSFLFWHKLSFAKTILIKINVPFVLLIWEFLICSVKIEALFIGDDHLGSTLVTEGCSGSRHLGLERVSMAQIQERSKGILQAKAGRVYV